MSPLFPFGAALSITKEVSMLHTRQDRQALVTLSGPLLTNLYVEAANVADVAPPEAVNPCAVVNVPDYTLNLGRIIATS